MNDILLAMRERALMDSAFRKAILATAENPDPLAALCDVAQQNGFNLTMRSFPAIRPNRQTAAIPCPMIASMIPTICSFCR